MEERKINIDREPITSAEIAARKDFNGVMEGAKGSASPGGGKAPFYKSGWFTTTFAGVALVSTTLVASFMINQEDLPQDHNSQETASAPVSDEFDYPEDSPCVKPPIKEMDIPYSTYMVNSETGGTIIHPSGTEIIIDDYSFVDSNGNEIQGDVEIRYREFHDQLDILLSGIPMEYDSAGTTYNFESAGMMDIQGYQNGKPIFIKHEKPLTISMHSENPDPDFNIYYLDEQAGNWNYKGKDDVLANMPEDAQIESGLSPDEITEKLNQLEPKVELAENNKQKAQSELNTATNQVKTITKEEPVKPRKVNPANNNFDLAVKPEEFPELAIYKNIQFEVSPDDKNFSPEVYNIKWTDAEITEKQKGKTYNLTLSKGNDVRTFEVYPAFEGKNYDAAMTVFNEKFKIYDQKLQLRKKAEAEKKAEYEAKLSEWERLRNEQLQLMAQYKEATTYTGGEDDGKKKKERISVRTKIARVFAVVTFGIWNADKTIPAKPSGQRVAASFVNQRLEPVLLSQVQLIERSRNSVYNFPSTEFHKIQWDPEENNVIVAVSPTGKVGFCDAQYMRSISKDDKRHTFKLKMLEGDHLSATELRKKLSL